MRFKIVSVGRRRADPVAPLVDDYLKRISQFVPVEDRVLKAEREDKLATRMLKEAQKGQVLVALDERGKEYSSKEFADLVSSWMDRGVSRVTFVIGGADGLPSKVKTASSLLIALSRMTLPHRFARLVLTEQLYRAFCIIRSHPYQK